MAIKAGGVARDALQYFVNAFAQPDAPPAIAALAAAGGVLPTACAVFDRHDITVALEAAPGSRRETLARRLSPTLAGFFRFNAEVVRRYLQVRAWLNPDEPRSVLLAALAQLDDPAFVRAHQLAGVARLRHPLFTTPETADLYARADTALGAGTLGTGGAEEPAAGGGDEATTRRRHLPTSLLAARLKRLRLCEPSPHHPYPEPRTAPRARPFAATRPSPRACPGPLRARSDYLFSRHDSKLRRRRLQSVTLLGTTASPPPPLQESTPALQQCPHCGLQAPKPSTHGFDLAAHGFDLAAHGVDLAAHGVDVLRYGIQAPEIRDDGALEEGGRALCLVEDDDKEPACCAQALKVVANSLVRDDAQGSLQHDSARRLARRKDERDGAEDLRRVGDNGRAAAAALAAVPVHPASAQESAQRLKLHDLLPHGLLVRAAVRLGEEVLVRAQARCIRGREALICRQGGRRQRRRRAGDGCDHGDAINGRGHTRAQRVSLDVAHDVRLACVAVAV